MWAYEPCFVVAPGVDLDRLDRRAARKLPIIHGQEMGIEIDYAW